MALDLIWRRKWGRREYSIAAMILTTISFAVIITFDSPSPSLVNEVIGVGDDDLVELTLVKDARQKGAVCLDGSSPGYHFQKGFDSGSYKWLLHIEGGGWCSSKESCSARKLTALGSSNYMDHQVLFTGMLSRKSSENPDFFNWNKVKIRYCDGASLSGNPSGELNVASTDKPRLFFRGQLIWEAIMVELLALGLSTAKQALLSGCSAGGLATLIHCDNFQEILPKEAKVKCLSDAGFFLDEKDIAGNNSMRSFYRDVANLQGVAKSLHKDCVSKMDPSQCLFPSEIIKTIKTPVFFVNPAYDFWQIQNVLAPHASDYHDNWQKCRLNLKDCNSNQTQILHGFRDSMLKTLNRVQKIKDTGMFINSCFAHCQTWMTSTWHSPHSPRINNKTLAEAVADWYFDKRVVKEIDCPYPCNPTCHNMDFSRVRS